MRTLLLTAIAVFGVILGRTQAVTDGHVDGNRHPAVLLLLMEVGGQPAFRCSGTLLSPTVLLTAGHCTNGFPDEDYSGMRVFTESDVQGGIGVTNNYPFAGPNAVEAVSWAAHPLYETAAFFVHDVGVVVLSAPITLPASQVRHAPEREPARSVQQAPRPAGCDVHGGRLRAAGKLPRSGNVPCDQHENAVLFDAAPAADQCTRLHRFVLAAALEQSQHRRHVLRRFRWPNFLGSGRTETRIVAGVTSYGLNGNCAGTGGVFRMDRQDVIDFVSSYLP